MRPAPNKITGWQQGDPQVASLTINELIDVVRELSGEVSILAARVQTLETFSHRHVGDPR